MALIIHGRYAKLLRENERLKAAINETKSATVIAFVTLAENGTIDEATATEHLDAFERWEPGIDYKVGNLRKYGTEEVKLYKCIQPHKSQADWTPDVAVSLWVIVGDPTVEFPEWSQPIGAQDAYMSGDKVSHNDKHWISEVDNNVWEPGVYGWRETD